MRFIGFYARSSRIIVSLIGGTCIPVMYQQKMGSMHVAMHHCLKILSEANI